MPQLSKARQKSFSALCKSNFRQIGIFNELAIDMEWFVGAGDNGNKEEGKLPTGWRPPFVWALVNGAPMTDELQEAANNPYGIQYAQDMKCPNYNAIDDSTTSIFTDGVLNMYFYGANSNCMEGTNYYPGEISSPNEFLMNSEHNPTSNNWLELFSNPNATAFDKRHLNKLNTLFLDGHVSANANIRDPDIYIP